MQDLKRSEWVNLDYDGWLKLFKENDKNGLFIDENSPATLTEEEKKLISKSIVAFQRGEHSEGISLRKSAEAFSKKYNEKRYPMVIDYFIKEENFHSKYLATFMRIEGIPIETKNFMDIIFRRIRKFNGIKSEVITLVTAEIIALTYYQVLGAATSSVVLKRICNQMLHDELPHIVFQSYTISHFKQSKLLKIKRRLLMEITTVSVYLAFYRFFKKNSCSFAFFRKENIGYLNQSKDIIRYMNDLYNNREGSIENKAK